MQDHFMSRLDKIETALRVIKDNHLHHMEGRLTKVEEGLSWIKGLLFSIIGIIIASSIGIIIGARW